MESENNKRIESVRKCFNKRLNSHGFSFQYSVLEKIKDLYDEKKSKWYFEAAEFPVAIKDHHTRIDFILRKSIYISEKNAPFYIVAECKRVNPSLLNWCFVKSPYIRRNRSREEFIFEHVEVDSAGILNAYGKTCSDIKNAFHIGMEVKSGKKGDSSISDRGAIESTATQVLKGVNGLTETMVRIFSNGENLYIADILPVIFTTAKIWVTCADLRETDLETGNIDLDNYPFKEMPWIVFQYHLSPGIKHSLPSVADFRNLAELLSFEYIRSIPIVNSGAIEDFLKWISGIERV